MADYITELNGTTTSTRSRPVFPDIRPGQALTSGGRLAEHIALLCTNFSLACVS